MTFFIIKGILVWLFVYVFVGRRFNSLWKAGLIGVLIMLAADYTGYVLNLYVYQEGYIYLGGIPLVQIINSYGFSLIYLNWLPQKWSKRLPYIIYISTLYLAIEAAGYQSGVIAYPNWSLGLSYCILVLGLSLLAYLSGFLFRDSKRSVGGI